MISLEERYLWQVALKEGRRDKDNLGKTPSGRKILARRYGNFIRKISRKAVKDGEALSKKVVGLIKDTQKAILERLSVIPKDRYEQRFRREILAELEGVVRRNWETIPDVFTRELADAVLQSQKQMEGVLDILPTQWTQALPAITVPESLIRTLSEFSADLVQGLQGVFLERLNRTLSTSLLAGDTLAQAIEKLSFIDKGPFRSVYARAETIVRTEWHRVINASNQARMEVWAKQKPGLKKIWITVIDDRTRPEHLLAHGQIVDVDKPFIVGGEKLMFPEDTSMGASPGNTINCRCAHVEVFPEMEAEIREIVGSQEVPKEIVKLPKPKPKRPVFQPAKTIKDAEQEAKRLNLATVVSYKGLHVEVANAMNEATFNTLQQFPVLRNQMDFLGTLQEQRRRFFRLRLPEEIEKLKRLFPGRPEKTLERIAKQKLERIFPKAKPRELARSVFGGTFAEGVRGIGFNLKFGKDKDILLKEIKNDVRKGFHPVGTDSIKAIVDHEMGHQLDALFDLGNDPEFLAILDKIKAEARRRGSFGFLVVMQDLSRYAGETMAIGSTAEIIAEAWTEFVNNPRPRWIAKRIGELILKKGGLR